MFTGERYRKLALLLLVAMFVGNVAAQPQRERRIVAEPTSSPAATTTTTRGETSAPGPRTLAELQSQIDQIVHQPVLQSGFFAIKIVSLDTGQIIFEQDANKFVRPASNMKLYTVAAAFDRLTSDYHFITSVYAKEKPDKGTIKGDLIVFGRGDPSIAARFNNGDYFKGINDLADRIVAAGIRRVKGNLVGDESYFNGAPLGSGWEWEDLQWGYGAQVSALTVNDNAIDLTVKPADRVSAPVVVTAGPPTASFMTIENRAVTLPRGSKSDLRIYRGLGANTLELTGSLALGDSGFSGSVAVSDPALAFVALLRDALSKRGVKIDGRLRTVDARTGGLFPNLSLGVAQSNANQSAFLEIASLQSPPFSLIAAHTLKPSQNLYTEIILRTLGKQRTAASAPPTTSISSATDEDTGLEIVRDFLHQAGVSDSSLYLSDGSGLSRNDMITANATVQLLTYMTKHRYFTAFRDALPIAGVDGTLRTRMRGTPAENNVRAKTGCNLFVLDRSDFLRILRDHPQFAEGVQKAGAGAQVNPKPFAQPAAR